MACWSMKFYVRTIYEGLDYTSFCNVKETEDRCVKLIPYLKDIALVVLE